ncbi:MAG: DUF1345 domain-containing protein [Actinomycetota bacterium]|nr:DUF1345 domain-containing protein [Actinomycetota bacterium]
MTTEPALIRNVSSTLRLALCSVVGLVAGGVTALLAPWQLAVLVGWSCLSGLLLLWVWAEIRPLDAVQTHARSTAEDSGPGTAVLVVVTACVVSLVGVALALVEARRADRPMEVALTSMSVLAVALAWCLVHTMFTLHYAHEYYTDPVGGIDFPGGAAPDYRDIAYFSFAIGMSFATSDTDISGGRVRRIALRHALVSYFFGAVIVGLVINVMAGFIQ